VQAFSKEETVELIIRPMRVDEAPAALTLWQAGCAAVGAPLRDEDARQVRANLERYADHPEARCFVAVAGGVLA
jgi:hypothetical protein